MAGKATNDVHLVGSIGLDSADEVFITAGRLLGNHLKRIPDGEPGMGLVVIGSTHAGFSALIKRGSEVYGKAARAVG